jgi:hypothetical protein
MFANRDMEIGKPFNPVGMLITREAKLYTLRLHQPHPEAGVYPALNVQRIFHGPGAIYAIAETTAEHDRAFMSMRMSNDMDGALDLYERNTNSIQFLYKTASIFDVAQKLRQCWQSPLPVYPITKPKK